MFVRKYLYFLSFRQSLGRNLLKISNGFPLTACGNDKFGQTLNREGGKDESFKGVFTYFVSSLGDC